MRLSLKTILAYSDDLFDAEYRPTIEKRIGEDNAAGYVIDRIRSVVRNPDIHVPGRYSEKEEISPNLVAAYLDNLLSDAEQSRFETICLRSDVYLAEIACSHQILTTILGQPAKLNRDCRLRLYGIPRHRKGISPNPPSNNENTESQTDMTIEPEPRKNRRITVTAQDNSVSHTKSPQEPNDMPSEHDTPSVDKEPAFGPTETTTRIAVGHISRLGQAFAHRKRHRNIAMVFSLALLFLCISAYMLAHFNLRHPEKETVQYKPFAEASQLTTPNSEITNDQRWDDSRNFWNQHDTVRDETVYSLNESPDRVMEYLPGSNGAPSQDPYTAHAPGSPLSLAQPHVPLPPALPEGFLDECPSSIQQSSSLQNPLHQPGSQTTINMSSVPPDTGTMTGNTKINGLHRSQNMTVGQYPVQPSQRHLGATIQLIDDHGSVPSVNRVIRPTLPAVQPANWGTDIRSDNSLENTQTGFNGQTALPQINRSIELASYSPDSGQPNVPPLTETKWNEANHGGFEQIPVMPQIPGNPVGSPVFPASPPLRLPGNVASSNDATARQYRRLVSGDNFADSSCPILALGMEDLALVRESPETEWLWLPVSKQLSHDIVLVPAPFRAVFMFPNGIVVETEGDTRVQILPDDEAGHPALAFDCGQLTVYAAVSRRASDISQSLRIVTPVGGGVLRFTDTNSSVVINSENKTTVKLLKVTRPYESVTSNPLLNSGNLDNNVVYCPNLMSFPAEGKTIYWQKDGHSVEWNLAAVSIFPIDLEKSIGPIILYNTSNLIVAPAVVWPSLISHDGRIPISKLDLKNQFVTMPHTFYPTPSKTWLLK